MKIIKEDSFDKIKNAEVQTEPFDHIIIDNLLPKDLYKEVSKELEVQDFPRNYKRGDYGNKERFGVDITDYSAWKNSGCNCPTTIHRDNYNLFLSKKLPSAQLFVNFILENEKRLYSALSSKLPTERIAYCGMDNRSRLPRCYVYLFASTRIIG